MKKIPEIGSAESSGHFSPDSGPGPAERSETRPSWSDATPMVCIMKIKLFLTKWAFVVLIGINIKVER